MTAAIQKKDGMLVLQACFLLVMSGLLWHKGALPIVHLLILAGLTGVMYKRRRQDVITALLPFVILLITYDSLRSFAGHLTPAQINITNLIAWERWLTGGMPAAGLRAAAAGRGWTPLLDALGNFAYSTHFVVPVGLSVWLSRREPRIFWPAVTVFLGLSYAGFITYVLVPAAPPWWATQHGYLSGAEAVSLEGFFMSPQAMLETPNPLAAIPSMHCAYPLYWALVVTRLRASLSWPFWLLTGLVGFSVVYLGHHYVVDVVAGWAYGLLAFALVRRWTGKLAPTPGFGGSARTT